MESQKNPRRKRKDPESRDFTCKCGKSYLSYAAAYTHVKNKHLLDKGYLDTIVKPERERLKRGRPKEKKQLDSNVDTQSLSVIEESILKIYTQLSQSQRFSGMILQGNQELDNEECEMEISFLRAKRHELSDVKIQSIPQKLELYDEFANSLNKHFSAKTAARIKILVREIAFLHARRDEPDVMSTLNSINLWEGHSNVNTIIHDALIRWLEINQKSDN